ncbi:NADH-quinone oxidoreductase subunit 9 [Fundidesulfovibrio magnetotacticus]|uniref:NADH-quinone oxidoreductase subunit 9 n=1 Tax=Fundidesulfovibrio magnetotacticus TaxID=2730080 RepID=A0A6V8LWP5_9BACT|nr:4Fe-4S dicluster domain-containing protein [Fundidesulfovibrio magnetotacticus]GFK94688.1 NADH-quinone oxidoreductase subunit 9 [Fundidesulfovibrio magnetotacticus]
MLPFLKIMVKNLLAGPSTDPFPFAPAHTPKRFRGRACHDKEKCILCGICRHVCAAGAIQLRVTEDGMAVHWVLWHNSCVFCGLCAHHCPTKALTMSDDWHMTHRGEERFDQREVSFVPYGQCSQCGARIHPRPESVVQQLGSRYPERFMMCPVCKRQELARRVTPAKPSITTGESDERDSA